MKVTNACKGRFAFSSVNGTKKITLAKPNEEYVFTDPVEFQREWLPRLRDLEKAGLVKLDLSFLKKKSPENPDAGKFEIAEAKKRYEEALPKAAKIESVKIDPTKIQVKPAQKKEI